jgi:hypothetical protein
MKSSRACIGQERGNCDFYRDIYESFYLFQSPSRYSSHCVLLIMFNKAIFLSRVLSSSSKSSKLIGISLSLFAFLCCFAYDNNVSDTRVVWEKKREKRRKGDEIVLRMFFLFYYLLLQWNNDIIETSNVGRTRTRQRYSTTLKFLSFLLFSSICWWKYKKNFRFHNSINTS